MGMNISALGQVATTVAMDSEYQRIIRELRALGLEPTGDKATDKAKLEAAKAQKSSQSNCSMQTQAVENVNETEKTGAISNADSAKNETAAAAKNMTGAEQIAQLNKLKLLGLY